MYIAIDTSTDTSSLALVQDGEVIAELTWRAYQSHLRQLLPNLEHLLRQIDRDISLAEAIIVAKGPGSYNGLRVGVSTAKGLAFSLGIPVIGVTTMEAEAYQHAAGGLPVCPVYNAGRGEIAAALYQQRGVRWRQLVPEHITTLDALAAETKVETLFAGEYVTAIGVRLRRLLGRKAVIASPPARLRRAAFLAELGLKRAKSGDYDDAATLQPLYLRGPAITQSKHL